MSDASEIDPYVSNISGGKYVLKKKLSEKARRALELTDEENTLLEMTMNLWFELGRIL